MAGTSGTVVHNVADGTAAGDAVNKGQLDAVASDVADIDNRVTTVEGDIAALQGMTGSLDYVHADGAGDGSDAARAASDSRGVAVGANAEAGGARGIAIGADSYAAGPDDTALGGNARVNADGSTAVGANTVIDAAATNAVAVGEGASVTASGAVALGQGSVADQIDTVSVGSAGNERRVVHVADAVDAHDAVNKGQMDAGDAQTLADAKAYSDAQVIAAGAITPDQVQDMVDAGDAQVRTYVDDITEAAVQDARAYADNGDQATLQSARAYADQQVAAMTQGWDEFRHSVDYRFQRLDKRLDRLGAMSAASTQMAINAAGASGNGRLAVGVGFQGGKSAMAVGYAASLGARTHVSFGGTFSGSEESVGLGFGFDL